MLCFYLGCPPFLLLPIFSKTHSSSICQIQGSSHNFNAVPLWVLSENHIAHLISSNFIILPLYLPLILPINWLPVSSHWNWRVSSLSHSQFPTALWIYWFNQPIKKNAQGNFLYMNSTVLGTIGCSGKEKIISTPKELMVLKKQKEIKLAQIEHVTVIGYLKLWNLCSR